MNDEEGLLVIANVHSHLKMFDPSQGGRMTVMQPLWGSRRLTVKYPYDFTGTSRAASSNLAIAVRRLVRMSHESTISIPMSTENRTFAARSARGLHVVAVEWGMGFCDATYSMSTGYGLTIFFFIFFFKFV